MSLKPTKKAKAAQKVDSDDEPPVKPAKKVANGKALTDFFDKVPPPKQPTARKASGTSQAAKAKAAPQKPTKKVLESDDDNDDDVVMEDSPRPVTKRTTVPRRAAKAVPKTYIDISDDNDGGGKSDLSFDDFD